MNPEYIKAEIRIRGSNLTKVALDAGLSECACRIAILFDSAPRADKAISKFLEKPLHELWPRRYNEDGTRKKSNPSNALDPKKKPIPRHCQKADAA